PVHPQGSTYTRRGATAPAAAPLSGLPRVPIYATVWYLPLTILKMWNFAPATSPFEVNCIGVPRIVVPSLTFENRARTSARVSLPSPRDVVIACAYIWART